MNAKTHRRCGYRDQQAWFHAFSTDSDEALQPFPIAIVEDFTGKVLNVRADKVTFLDPGDNHQNRRKCEYETWDRREKRTVLSRAWFHCFSLNADDDHKPFPIAIVEDFSGRVRIVHAENVTFLDPIGLPEDAEVSDAS